MTEAELDENSTDQLQKSSRWSIYALIAICSVVVMTARLWQVEAVSYDDKTVPFLSANDRSRWCTIRALGDHDTYSIDPVLQAEDGRAWDTIDKVVHWGRDFQPHSYSSKPTLLPTLLTYPYKVINFTTGLNLRDDTFVVVRCMLLAFQILPLVLFFWAIGRIADSVAESEWTRIFLMVAACFGTYITTFAISLNNHVPAVISIAIATAGLVQLSKVKTTAWGWYFMTGLTAAFAAANELPALSFLVFAMFYCLLKNVKYTVCAFLPAMLLVVAGFFGTNIRAHNDWRPAYSHRSDGPVVAIVPGSFREQLDNGTLTTQLWQAIRSHRADIQELQELSLTTGHEFNSKVVVGGWPMDEKTARRWIVYFQEKVAPMVIAERADGIGFEVRQWDNWYEYPGSYWLTDNDKKSEIDRGVESKWDYFVNLTVWHHGVFSLTPIWLIAVAGVFLLIGKRHTHLRLFGLGILAISIVVFFFYVNRPMEDRNYGGWTCAPRWFFWLIPLWLLAMIPALDRISESRIWRFVAMLLLVSSIASACFAWTNPWVHPWIYQMINGTG